MAKPYLIAVLIERASDEFERLFGVRVTAEARNALLLPAVEHRDEVELQLQTGELTEAGLYPKIIEQLRVASEIAAGRHGERFRESALGDDRVRIESGDAVASMEKHCAVLFWC